MSANLTLLGLETRVINAIMTKTWYDPTSDSNQLLFADTKPDGRIVYRNQEMMDIIAVYDSIKGNPDDIATGELDNPLDFDPSDYNTLHITPERKTFLENRPTLQISNDLAFTKFDQHLNELVQDRERKVKLNLLIRDDTVFEAPSLKEYRRQEILRNNLLDRKKIPVKGFKCVRGKCKSDEIYQTELFTRSGDEGGVWYNECAKCGHMWKN